MLEKYCSFGKSYLKCERRVPHHTSQPAQSLIYKTEDGKESDQIGCDVGHEAYGGGRATASSLQDVLLISEEFKRGVVFAKLTKCKTSED